MSPRTARDRAGRSLPHWLGAGLAAAAVLLAGAASGAESVSVILDRATVLKMPEKVSTVIVGNPLIADVSLQPGGIMVLTGKGYGITNVLALDRSGTVLMEKSLQVLPARDDVVVVYRGAAQESYSCNPNCERRITLGDAQAHFEAALAQTVTRTGQAQGK
jgi:Flp pilus assembly secretin CpaC